MSGRAARYRRSPDALSRSVASEVLVCLPDWDEIDRLSTSGAAVWRSLARPRTVAELTAEVAGEYGVRTEAVRNDIRGFVELLVKRGLVERIPATGGNGTRGRERKEVH